jgi:20S proteasome alpha/beta subunit
MDTVIGIKGEDFVLLASDAMCGRSIIVFKQDEDKMLQLNSNAVLAMAGAQGDRDSFGNLIKRNISLKELRDQRQLSTSEIAHFVRSELHDALRSAPVQVNLLIGGVDVDQKTDESGAVVEQAVPSLYYMDYLASMIPLNYGVHGHASSFCLSLLDADWKRGLNREQVIDLFKLCRKELQTRFLISFAQWKVRILTKDGVEEISVD